MRAAYSVAIAMFCAVLLFPAVVAFQFDLATVSDNILPGESASFELTITNTADQNETYVLTSEQFGYLLFIDERPGTLAPGQTGTFKFNVGTRATINYGTHLVPLAVRAVGQDFARPVEVILFIRDPSAPGAEYRPNVALSVDAPNAIDPRSDFIVNIHLENRNARTYDANDPVTVTISSDIFYDEFNLNLGPVTELGQKSTERRIDLDPFQAPGTHELTVQVLVRGVSVSEHTRSFEIADYADVSVNEYSSSSFFKSETVYTVLNDGNTEGPAHIDYSAPFWRRPFISVSEDARVEDGQIIVERSIAPQAEVRITVTENYRLLVLLVILGIVSVVGYYLLRSPVILSKEASVSKGSNEGSSHIKVRILLKNRSSVTLKNVRLIDRISDIAHVQKDTGLGTLKPTKVVKKAKEGTLLRWDLEQLEPFEERIITYTSETTLKLIGDVVLPSAKVKFDVPNGRERTTHSNEVSVGR